MFSDRLFIDKKKRKPIIEDQIDEGNFLEWDKNREKLILFSMAAGIDSPVPRTGANDGIQRGETIQSDYDLQALMICAAIANSDLKTTGLDAVLTEDNIYASTEACMNSGLDKISRFISEHGDENYIDNYLIPEMDRMFEDIK